MQHESEEAEANRQTASLAGLAVVLLLLVVCLMLVHTLRHEAKMEDCLMSGRTNCNEICSLPTE